MGDVVFYTVAALYFLYPVVFATIKKVRQPVLIGVAAHGVNVALLVLCIAIYSPIYFWLRFVAPSLDNFDYLQHVSWVLDGFRMVEELGYFCLFLVGFITPYVLCRRGRRDLG